MMTTSVDVERDVFSSRALDDARMLVDFYCLTGSSVFDRVLSVYELHLEGFSASGSLEKTWGFRKLPSVGQDFLYKFDEAVRESVSEIYGASKLKTMSKHYLKNLYSLTDYFFEPQGMVA